MRHLLTLATLDQDDFIGLVARAVSISREPQSNPGRLSGTSVGIHFRATSTRTRTSFTVAAARLGAYPVVFGATDLQTQTGETIEDTATVLAKYLDALVVRTAANPGELQRIAALNRLPIINAMTADEHPTQAISDFAFISKHFGRLSGLRLLYVGEANNTAVALAYAASRTPGFEAEFRTPTGYSFSAEVLVNIERLGRRYGGRSSVSPSPPAVDDPGSADILYTTRWQTTGTSKSDPNWRTVFSPFQITESLANALYRDDRSIFMHDLPAVREDECTAAVLDGSRSVAFEQAEQKLFTAMATLEWCVGATR